MNRNNYVQLQQSTLKNNIKHDESPLSYAQQRLWILNEMEPNSSLYNMVEGWHLFGPINIAILEKSLVEIIRRHQSLRTTFRKNNGVPIQVINKCPSSVLEIINLNDNPDGCQLVEGFIKEEVNWVFDLEKGPLFRAKLLKLGNEEHVLILNMHHIISDGWSIGILIEELNFLYHAYFNGTPASLPELPMQYTDFACWQQKWIKSNQMEEQLNYWLKKLQGSQSTIYLPTDRSYSNVQRFKGAIECCKLHDEIVDGIKSIAKREGSTLFMVLLAAFKTLLYRYSDQKDIVIGTPIANRTIPETEGVIGFFVNMLAIRTNISEDLSFLELLRSIRETSLDAFKHQYIPFDKLVMEIQPERDSSHSPLFQVTFAMQNSATSALELPNIIVEKIQINNKIGKFNLSLSVEETPEGVITKWEYNADLFDSCTIKRMIQHFLVLLEGIKKDPEQPLWRLPLLTETERYELLYKWNDTKNETLTNRLLIEEFEEQVERTPNNIAIVFKDQQLTYRELNKRINQLARYLKKMGVGTDSLVGLCMDQSLEMVISIFAIWKAGGAYVPLDPNYPQERLDYIVEDTKVSLLLTKERFINILNQKELMKVCLDSEWPLISKESTENIQITINTESLAYVIYTSGSTGRPKGVMVPHRGLYNVAGCLRKIFNVTPESRILQFASINFDGSLCEILMALVSGARLCIAPQGSLLLGEQLHQFIRDQEITHLNLVPSALLTLSPQNLPSLRVVISGGEACTWEVVERWSQNFSFFNAYGPTETTICVSVANLSKDSPSITIGSPMDNVKIYVLDKHLQPVPIGVVGEIFIESPGLALGYLNQSELTKEKFVQSPFDNKNGTLLYRTGDLAKWNKDGQLEFIGRIDSQVKIRGFRIELGEVESAIMKHPDVKQAVVVTKNISSENMQLIAYIVPANKTNLQASELKQHLKGLLPSYMIPSMYEFIDNLPKSPNGKIDRSVLAKLPINFISNQQRYIAYPRDLIEQELVRIWESVLGMSPISIRDNFFDLGGHSLLLIQMLAKIKKTFGKDIPVSTVFQNTTIEEIALTLRRDIKFRPGKHLVAINKNGDKQPLYFVHHIGGYLFSFTQFFPLLDRDQPLYGLQVNNPSGDYDSIEEMAAAYVNEIINFQTEGPYMIAGYSFGGIVAFEMARQLQKQGKKVNFLAIIDTYLSPHHGKEREEEFSYIQEYVDRFKVTVENQLTMDDLKNLSPTEQVNYFLKLAKKSRHMPSDAEYEDMYNDFNIWLTNLKAFDRYCPKKYEGKITFFKAIDEESDSTYGWEYLSNEIEVITVPGNHLSLIRSDASGLARKFNECLSSVNKH